MMLTLFVGSVGFTSSEVSAHVRNDNTAESCLHCCAVAHVPHIDIVHAQRIAELREMGSCHALPKRLLLCTCHKKQESACCLVSAKVCVHLCC